MPTTEELRLPILRGLSFESKFSPTDPPDDDATSSSDMHQDLIAIQSKLAEVQDSQKSILLAISELKASFASDFASVISLLDGIKASMAAGNHNVGGEFEDPMHSEASSEVTGFCCVVCFPFMMSNLVLFCLKIAGFCIF